MADKDYLSRSLKIIRFFAKNAGTAELEANKGTLLNELVKYVKALSENSQAIAKLASESLIAILRTFISDKDRSYRINTLKALRYILDSAPAFQYLRSKHVYIFLAKNLDRENKPENTEETIQTLKLIRKWIEIDAKSFPKLLVNSIVGLTESQDEVIRKTAVESLRILSMANPELSGWAGGIKTLIDLSVDPNCRELSHSIILTLIYLLNDPNTRSVIKPHLDLTRIFSLFTDVDYPVESRDGKKDHLVRFENQLEIAKKAIVMMLKSWTGLIYLGHDRTSLKSLITALRQPIKPLIRNAIYDILNEILTIGIKNIPKRNYDSQMQNLINYYLMVVIELLMECDLFTVLLELSGVEDREIANPAQKFLKNLSYLNFTLLSQNHQQYPNFLVASSEITNPVLMELKSRSYNVVHSMGDYLFDSVLERRKEGGSRFLSLCENLYLSTQLGLPSHKMNNEIIGKIKTQLEMETDDQKFAALMKSSLVTQNREPKNWNWADIIQITDTYLTNMQRLGEAIRTKFLKRLLNFYQPSKQGFISLEWKPENFPYVKVGYKLLKTILKYKEGKQILSSTSDEFFSASRSFMVDMSGLLRCAAEEKPSNSKDNAYVEFMPLLSHEVFNQRMIREYICWIGLLSMSKVGLELLNEFQILQSLTAFVTKTGEKDHILTLIIFNLDYKNEGEARNFLQYCLENGSKGLIKSGIELLRLLYRSELNDFAKWGLPLLCTMLYRSEQEFSLLALNVIEEVCQDKEYMHAFLSRGPKFTSLGKNGNNFLITLLSIKQGFEYLTNVTNWIEAEMERWKETENREYVQRVERCLLTALDLGNFDDANNGFKMSDFWQNDDNASTHLSFVFRLPWNMILHFENEKFEGDMFMQIQMEYNPQNSQLILIGLPKPPNSDFDKKLTVHQDAHFVMKLHLTIGKVNIDNLCKETGSPFTIRCGYNDKKHNAQYIGNQCVINQNGVIFIFDCFESTIRLSQIKVAIKLDNLNSNNLTKLPPHLYGELVKTRKGVELLRQTKYFESFVEDMLSPDCPILKKRASLWCIGHIGLSKNGFTLIKEHQLVPKLVQMAQEAEFLSLRGTCLYVLNLLANTLEGSYELEKCNWLTHITGANIKVCLPKDLKQFFTIKSSFKDLQKAPWPLQDDLWKKFDEIMKSLHHSEEQLEVLHHISGLSSAMTNKTAQKELKKLSTKSPNLFTDAYLFYSVIMMMTFYKFRTQMRRYIYSLFDKLLSNQKIFAILDSTQCFGYNII